MSQFRSAAVRRSRWIRPLLLVAGGIIAGLLRSITATPRVGVMEIQLKHTLSRLLWKYGENPHEYNIQSAYHAVLSQSMEDGTIWIMYNHCPEGDEYVMNEEYRKGRVGTYYIGCEAHFVHFDPAAGRQIGNEVVFADFEAYPQQRNQGFFVHGPNDGEHANCIVLGIWAAQCKTTEDVCLCTNDKCGFDTSKNRGCNAGWRGKVGATYCQNEGWLGGVNGTGWSCGTHKKNVGTLNAPVNGGQTPGKLYLVKLTSSGELIYSKEAFYFDGEQNEGTGDFFGKLARFTDPVLKTEVEDWVYGWLFSTNMGNICDYHWGCQGKMYRATDGEVVESRLWCSHCNGRSLGFDDENKNFGFSCGTDGGPGVFFNGQKVTRRGQTENINTSKDNTHRDNHPAVSHFRGDVWLILYRYIATEYDSEPADLRLLQWDTKQKKILFSKVMTETPEVSEGGNHHLEKFGDHTWLMAWSGGGRSYAAEVDAWGNYLGEIVDITDYATWGSQTGWWRWRNGDIGFVGAWDWQPSPYEGERLMMKTPDWNPRKSLNILRITGSYKPGDCIGKFLPVDTKCNKCCEMRERYTVEVTADGGRKCPLEDGYIRTTPCKGGECPKLTPEQAEQAYTEDKQGIDASLGIDGKMDTTAVSWTKWGYGGHTWYKVQLKAPSVVSGVNFFTDKQHQQKFGLSVLFYDSKKELIGRCYINLNNLPSGSDKEEPVDERACTGLQMYGVKTVMFIPTQGFVWDYLYVREIHIFGKPCNC